MRPSKSYAPFIASPHPGMNLVVIRENEEDLYAGIEHQQTPEVTQVLKLVTRPGRERIIRYAVEYARAYGRHKVTCMTNDNIMKLTDGLFHRVFDEIAPEYPGIDSDHQIIDIGAARVAAQPIIERLGDRPTQLAPVDYRPSGVTIHPPDAPAVRTKQLVGVDAFLDWNGHDREPTVLGAELEAAAPQDWTLRMITHRGVMVYPTGMPETFRTDHWRCRLVPADGGTTSFDAVLALLGGLHQRGLEVITTEHLSTFDGQRAYSLGQGE